MMNTIPMLLDRKSFLSDKKALLEAARDDQIEGRLRINRNRNRTEYYHCRYPGDYNGKYISVRNKDLICSLAQKDYDNQALNAIDQELNVIGRCLDDYPKITVEDIYPALAPERRELVIPVVDTDEILVEKWLSVEYLHKGFEEGAPEHYTARGLRVRSKSEVIIANYLDQMGIPYRYEWPVRLASGRIVYPDFLILNVRQRREVIYEHFGEMDDPDYARDAVFKMKGYEMSGFRQGESLVITMETQACPLDIRLVQSVAEKYFM